MDDATLRAAILRELPLADKRGWLFWYTRHDVERALDKVLRRKGS